MCREENGVSWTDVRILLTLGLQSNFRGEIGRCLLHFFCRGVDYSSCSLSHGLPWEEWMEFESAHLRWRFLSLMAGSG